VKRQTLFLDTRGSHGQQFFVKAANLALSVHKVDLQNPVPFLTLVI
jgi:hypothetical protein